MQSSRIGPFLIAAPALLLIQPATTHPAWAASIPASTVPATTDHSDPIASAMSAAPAAVGRNATIVAMADDGSMKTLREGSNGWTCMPDSPATPGPDPMCMDANALKWGMAWMSHGEPPAETPGFMYMLEGGTDASNTDPYATKPDGDWIKTGPHVMIVGSMKALAGYPSGPNPDTSVPYVMWAGTPYAHLMIPVE
ncbi:hypothetical protein [Croceicoccus sp. BE223]|uniref:hypothetical protein n=1 Tax=Croceicoccus sp. BE223 TaxID=2817716 RepID=UPI0028676892|nr:hypothetical protein [Croceicoccus sp. BE223]MDR7101248.1 hypothetical protein [Croceicoccus sp. BE223]